jgi:hypothetical protein
MKKVYLIAAVMLLSLKGFSQGSPDYGAGMKFNLNQDGSKYMRFIAWNQIWFVPANESRTMIGEAATTGTDIGNRRLVFCLLNYPKIHDCDTLGITKLYKWSARIFRNGGMSQTRNIFPRCLERMH